MVVSVALEAMGESQLWSSVWPLFRCSCSSLLALWALSSASICCDNLRLRLFSDVTHVGVSLLLFVSVRTRMLVPLHPRLDLDDQGRLELAIEIVVFVQHTNAVAIDGTAVRPYDRFVRSRKGGVVSLLGCSETRVITLPTGQHEDKALLHRFSTNTPRSTPFSLSPSLYLTCSKPASPVGMSVLQASEGTRERTFAEM